MSQWCGAIDVVQLHDTATWAASPTLRRLCVVYHLAPWRSGSARTRPKSSLVSPPAHRALFRTLGWDEMPSTPVLGCGYAVSVLYSDWCLAGTRAVCSCLALVTALVAPTLVTAVDAYCTNVWSLLSDEQVGADQRPFHVSRDSAHQVHWSTGYTFMFKFGGPFFGR